MKLWKSITSNGSISLILSSSASNVKADKLKNSISGADYTNATDEELMDACKQFEAYFLEQVFKSMMKTVPNQDKEGSTSQLLDFFKDSTIQELASVSTETNGTGLAQQLYEQMKRNYSVDE